MSISRAVTAPAQTRISTAAQQHHRVAYTPRSESRVKNLAEVDAVQEVSVAVREIHAENGFAEYHSIRRFMEHKFVEGPRKYPRENNTVPHDSRFHLPPLSPPEDRVWRVYPEDIVTANDPDTWGIPITLIHVEKDEEKELDDARKIEYAEVGGEEIKIMLFNDPTTKTWKEALDKELPWVCKFPGKIFCGGGEQEMQLVFRYNRTVADFITSTKTRIPIELPHLAATLRAFLGPHVRRIVPVQMWVTNESAQQLPTDINVQLLSKQISADGKSVTLKPWFFNTGPNPSPDPHESSPVMSHWVSRGTYSSEATTPTFWCSPKVMTAEFARWAATDFDKVQELLDSDACKDGSKETVRQIRGVPVKGCTPKNELQFLCLSEWQRIVYQTELGKNTGTPSCNVKVVKEDDQETGQFRVGEKLISQFIKEKVDAVDGLNNIMDLYTNDLSDKHSALVMHLNQVHTSLPTHSLQDKDPVSYHCTVHLRFCVLD